MYHSIIIRVDGKYIDTWDDWHLIPASRPVIAPPKERTNFVTVGGRSGVLDFSQTLAGKAVFDDRTGSLDFYVENDYWDWETAYTTICEALQGKRVQLALEDNPAHYYEGLLYVDKWSSEKGHSKISLKYDLHPDMQTLPLTTLEFVEKELTMTAGMVTDLHLKVLPTNTFYRKVTITSWPAGIAEVTADGLVRAIQNGVTEVRAVCGAMTAVCKVTVKNGTFWSIRLEDGGVGVTSTNHANKIQNGRKYETTLTAPEGYILTAVKIYNGSGGLEGTIGPDEYGTTATVSLPSVTGNIRIVAETAAQPFVSVRWDLDCVEAENPVVTVQKGRTVKFKIAGVTPYYILDIVTVTMNDTKQTGCITWDGLDGAAITLKAAGDITIAANARARFTLDDCSWGMIDRIAKSGRGAEFFKAGDTKTLKLSTTISGNSFDNVDPPTEYEAVLLGINHNPAVEGAANLHFGINGLVKSSYIASLTGNTFTVANSELMNLIGRNVPGDSTEKERTLLMSLPEELTSVMVKVPKTVYDVTKKAVVTEKNYLWLPSVVEVFGKVESYGRAEEANTQKQYAYFTSSSAKRFKTWLRSPGGNNTNFCQVQLENVRYSGSDGQYYDQEEGVCRSAKANTSYDAILCFALGSGDTAVLDKTILDKSVLG